MEALEAILPEADGTYQLTISVLSRDEQFTGTTLLTFSVGERLFTDLSGDSPYYDAACYLCQKGIFMGTGQGTFQPDQTMTRGMLAEVLYRMQGSPDIAITEQAFSDVQSESWYAAAVSWAKEEEVLLGIYDGVFGADQAVTTEQLATALYRLEIKNGNQAELENADLQEGQTCASEYAREAVSWAYGEGILQGENGALFNSRDSLTRAQAALILAAYLQR